MRAGRGSGQKRAPPQPLGAAPDHAVRPGSGRARTRARLVDVTQHVGHASLVGQEGGQMRRLAAVVLREGLDFATEAAGALARQEAERAVAWPLELTMRHLRQRVRTGAVGTQAASSDAVLPGSQPAGSRKAAPSLTASPRGRGFLFINNKTNNSACRSCNFSGHRSGAMLRALLLAACCACAASLHVGASRLPTHTPPVQARVRTTA
jgi:hypothetical protein